MGSNIINQLLGDVVFSIFAAFIVQFATNKVAGFKPSYVSAYIASLLNLVLATLTTPLIGILVVLRSTIGMVLYIALVFFVGALIYGWMLRHPTSGPIGIRKGFFVSLIQLVVVTVLLVAVLLVFAAYKYLST